MKKQVRRKRLSLGNKIKAPCVECGITHTIAYWDEELEHYIYLMDLDKDDNFYCEACLHPIKMAIQA